MTNAPVREDDGPRINEDIRTKEVRLIDENGENCGIVPIREALSRAEDAGLDLIEISPQAVPPVCKILDYGKYKYEVQKRKNEAKKNQKVVEIKELKLRRDWHPWLRSQNQTGKEILVTGQQGQIHHAIQGPRDEQRPRTQCFE